MMIDPGKVRARLALAIERVDLDIDTAFSLADDVVTLDELTAMIRMGLGGVLIADVVDMAFRVMFARYPEELVRRQLGPDYDLRQIYPVSCTDIEHDRAVAIVNRRAGRISDLAAGRLDQTDDGIDDVLADLGEPEQLQVFTAVFFISMSKISALKYLTGID